MLTRRKQNSKMKKIIIGAFLAITLSTATAPVVHASFTNWRPIVNSERRTGTWRTGRWLLNSVTEVRGDYHPVRSRGQAILESSLSGRLVAPWQPAGVTSRAELDNRGTMMHDWRLGQ